MTTTPTPLPSASPVPDAAPAAPRRPRSPISGVTLAAVGFLLWSIAILVFLTAFIVHAHHVPTTLTARMHFDRLSLLLAAGGVLAFWGLLLLVMGAVRSALGGNLAAELRDLKLRIAERDAALGRLAAQVGQSDVARRLANRQADLAALRQAIRDDLGRRAYDSAMILVGELAGAFGQRHEAEQFREQIAAARQAETEQKIAAAITQFDQLLTRHEWDKAIAEAAKLQRLYPDAPTIRGLEKNVRDAREQHKKELEREFLEAAQKDDVDRAIELLKHLDKYLTTAEAEPFRETARGVIGKKRDNLGVRFKMAVHDKEWVQAVRVGEQIIREFPNTRMADEVRSLLDVLRERAAAQNAARVSGAAV